MVYNGTVFAYFLSSSFYVCMVGIFNCFKSLLMGGKALLFCLKGLGGVVGYVSTLFSKESYF